MLNDWGDVLRARGSNEKALAYQAHIDGALDRFFPVRTTTQNSTDPPWIKLGSQKAGEAEEGSVHEGGEVQEMETAEEVDGGSDQKKKKHLHG